MEKNYHKDNKSFIVYKDWEDLFDALSDAEAGQLLKALFTFAKCGEDTEFTGALKMAYITMRNCLERDGKKWEKKCERNSENIRKRWNKNNTTEYERIPTNTNDTDKDKDTDIDIDKDKDTDNDTDTDTDTAVEVNNACEENSVCEFEKFFSLYPKKVSKQKAFREWNRINPSSEMSEQIITALQYQCRSENWQKENGRFIPFPEKYLRDRRWEDDLSALPQISHVPEKDYSFNIDDYKSLVNNFQ